MKIGKLSNETLKKVVLDKISSIRNEVLLKPITGEDCSALDLENDICVITSDPITGASSQLGFLAVHVCCNDIAASGAEPVGIMVTILSPSHTIEEELSNIMSDLSEAAKSVNIDIIGGHTEITDAVKRTILSCTCIGRVKKDKLIKSSGAKPGDDLIMTKFAGLEGTAIIANEHENELIKKVSVESITKAKTLINDISVLKEGRIASLMNVSSMHDATEGGILGAIWELCEASRTGANVYIDNIPILDVTNDICTYYNLNPLRLISSGSLLITCNNGAELIKALLNEGINAVKIGEITSGDKRIIITNNQVEELSPPESDDLYKVPTHFL